MKYFRVGIQCLINICAVCCLFWVSHLGCKSRADDFQEPTAGILALVCLGSGCLVVEVGKLCLRYILWILLMSSKLISRCPWKVPTALCHIWALSVCPELLSSASLASHNEAWSWVGCIQVMGCWKINSLWQINRKKIWTLLRSVLETPLELSSVSCPVLIISRITCHGHH